jgi:hypothetical protein
MYASYHDCIVCSRAASDKWVAMFQKLMPQQKIAPSLQMCCYMDSDPN